MKILVADDDKSIRVLVVRMLEKIGVGGIIQAADGREALLQLQENTFDLVVTDWEMPWHSGLEIVRAIRASGSRVPILMITVRTERAQVLEAIGAGVSDFLAKPLQANVLYDKLTRLCEHADSLNALQASTGVSMKTEYINPFITSIISLFDTMMGVAIKRGTPFLSPQDCPEHEVSGIIGLMGRANGTAVVSLGANTAMHCTGRLLGKRSSLPNSDVIDTMGELANIVAGAAKAQLQQLDMTIGLPSVITGRDHLIGFPRGVRPICVPFTCDWGPIALQVGLQEQTRESIATRHGINAAVAR